MAQNLDSGVNAEDLEAFHSAAACEAPTPAKKAVAKPAVKEATAPKKTSKSNKSNA